MKLPALYLLDSVAKNLRDKYASLLEAHVAELYTLVWEALPQSRRSLEHLRATWRGVFPAVRPVSCVNTGSAARGGEQNATLAARSTPVQPLASPCECPCVETTRVSHAPRLAVERDRESHTIASSHSCAAD